MYEYTQGWKQNTQYIQSSKQGEDSCYKSGLECIGYTLASVLIVGLLVVNVLLWYIIL